jgi:hypothetical protein
MLTAKPTDFQCAIDSTSRDEQLVGTASYVTHWLLIEYPGRWGKNALDESSLSDEVKTYAARFSQAHPASKVLLIKRDHSSDTRRVYFIDHGRLGQPQPYAFDLQSHDDLLHIDLSDENSLEAHRHDQPFVTICTNGIRDNCCALVGLQAWMAITESGRIEAWQSSHVGQHRLAPNLIQFPHGIYHGRMNAAHQDDFLDDLERGRLHLNSLRGSAFLPQPAQAAEYFLRAHTGNLELAALRSCQVTGGDDARWDVALILGGVAFIIQVQKVNTGITFYASCDGDKTAEGTEWQLIGVEEQQHG